MDRFFYNGIPIDTDAGAANALGVVQELKSALQVALRKEEADAEVEVAEVA